MVRGGQRGCRSCAMGRRGCLERGADRARQALGGGRVQKLRGASVRELGDRRGGENNGSRNMVETRTRELGLLRAEKGEAVDEDEKRNSKIVAGGRVGIPYPGMGRGWERECLGRGRGMSGGFGGPRGRKYCGELECRAGCA